MSSLKTAEAAGVSPLGANDRMVIDWWPTDKLWQAAKNPRRYTAKEIKKAERILKRWGVRLPLVITSDGCVIAHFVAVIAARKARIDQLPVVYADDLPAAEHLALSLALDRFYELGEFDRTLLGELLTQIEVDLPDLRFGDIGFDAAEVDQAVAATPVTEEPEKGLSPTSAIVSKIGDVWMLGGHRVACEDAKDSAAYARLLGGKRAQMCFTDPPYGCEIQGFVSSRGHREFVEASGELDEAGLKDFFAGFCAAIARHVDPGAVIELCIDWRSASLLMKVASSCFGEMINLAVWVKDRGGMGSFLRSQHELILIYAMPGGRPRNNVELGKHGRNRTNVWKYPCAMSFQHSGAEGDLLDGHPTPKPKDLVADAILDCTARGDIVLDPFLGSGSTLIAAEKVGRLCFGMDLDPAYADLAIRRWQSWTGRQAVHAETGKLFDDLLAAAEMQLGTEERSNG
jgi:DNA modification methylase